jgi:hypothetical protein
MVRRNDIVYQISDDAPAVTPYGRVWRRVSPTHVDVIFCTRDVRRLPDTDLEVHNHYKGHEWNGRFRRMSTLRQLKKVARHSMAYHQERHDSE